VSATSTRAEPPARLVGYIEPIAGGEIQPKRVMMLWEGNSGSVGRVWWTGSYWAIRPWSDIRPEEHAALKRVAPKAKLSTLPELGDSDVLALWTLAKHRPTGEVTNSQRAFLAKQGVRIPQNFPRLLASETLDLLGSAKHSQDPTQQWIGPRPDSKHVACTLEALRALGPHDPVDAWVQAMARLQRAIECRPSAAMAPTA
jgi:hypothetical protein